MPQTETHQPRLSDSRDADVDQYRAVSGLAVMGLIFGLLAITCLIDPVMCVVALLGTLLNGLALWKITHGEGLIGRKAAVLGLTLSVLFATAVPAEWLTHRWLIRNQARQFASIWFEHLRQQQPEEAYLLSKHAKWRGSPDEEGFETYKARPVVEKLLSLGQQAEVSYCRTESQQRGSDRDFVRQLYTVTWGQSAAKKTLSIVLEMERSPYRETNLAYWRMADAAEESDE